MKDSEQEIINLDEKDIILACLRETRIRFGKPHNQEDIKKVKDIRKIELRLQVGTEHQIPFGFNWVDALLN